MSDDRSPSPNKEPGDQEPSPESTGATGAESPKLNPGWKKLEIIGRPLAGLLTALSVAAIGWFGQMWLSSREEAITKRIQKQEDTRLYTELMSRREEADSALRTTMFKMILDDFMGGFPGGGAEVIATRLLRLELLALNFGDSLSLSPLFLALDREIERPSEISNKEKKIFRNRLRSLARRVSGAQLAALIPDGEGIRIQIPLDAVAPGKTYDWPRDAVDEWWENNKDLPGADADAETSRKATRVLDEVKRSYEATFRNADRELETVEVKLTIRHEEVASDPIEMKFKLDFFNFPMIDNTRLSHDQRFALVLERFSTTDGHILVRGVCFPGIHASLRDRPFLDDIIERLNVRTLKETGELVGSTE